MLLFNCFLGGENFSVGLRALCKKYFSDTEWYKVITGNDDLERLVYLHHKVSLRRHSIKVKFKPAWLGSKKEKFFSAKYRLNPYKKWK